MVNICCKGYVKIFANMQHSMIKELNRLLTSVYIHIKKITFQEMKNDPTYITAFFFHIFTRFFLSQPTYIHTTNI